MTTDMSPQAVSKRLKLVAEITRTCLRLQKGRFQARSDGDAKGRGTKPISPKADQEGPTPG